MLKKLRQLREENRNYRVEGFIYLILNFSSRRSHIEKFIRHLIIKNEDIIDHVARFT